MYGPVESIYENERFEICLTFDDNYPEKPPIVEYVYTRRPVCIVCDDFFLYGRSYFKCV